MNSMFVIILPISIICIKVWCYVDTQFQSDTKCMCEMTVVRLIAQAYPSDTRYVLNRQLESFLVSSHAILESRWESIRSGRAQSRLRDRDAHNDGGADAI